MRIAFSLLGLVVVAALLLWLAKGQLSAMSAKPAPAAAVQGIVPPRGTPENIEKKVQSDLQKAADTEAKRLQDADK